MSIVTAEGLNSSESQPSSGLHAKGPEAKELIEISAFIHKHTYMHTNNSCFTLKCIIFQSESTHKYLLAANYWTGYHPNW